MISKKLPDSHSDFIYALISEELGIVVAIAFFMGSPMFGGYDMMR